MTVAQIHSSHTPCVEHDLGELRIKTYEQGKVGLEYNWNLFLALPMNICYCCNDTYPICDLINLRTTKPYLKVMFISQL